MLFGCVRDYVVVPWFPALNPADVMLTFGSLAVVYAIVREKV
jgi:lipoprotein signal peptidase